EAEQQRRDVEPAIRTHLVSAESMRLVRASGLGSREWCLRSNSTLTPRSLPASASNSASSTRVSVPATAGGCRVVTTRGSADVADGPRFVAKQVRALDRDAPRLWRRAGLSRFQPRDLSPCESGATGPTGDGRVRVHAVNRKQGARLDGHAVGLV